MRGVFALITVSMLLAACQQEPDFDERFDEQSEIIKKQGRSIEASVDNRLKAAAEADAALGRTADIEPAGSNQGQ